MASPVVLRTGVVPELGRAYGSSYFLRRLPPPSEFAFSRRDFDAQLPFLSRSGELLLCAGFSGLMLFA